MATPSKIQSASRFPILALLHPREHTRFVVALLGLGLLLWGLIVWSVGLPLWGATSIVLAMLLIPGVQKWRADRRRYGMTVMVLSVLLTMQGFHSVEHAVQWFQYHILHWPPWWSNGLISAANAEWVHFVWNWAVVAVVIFLVSCGVRNIWAWGLLAWAVAHALEHSYMMARYLELVQELKRQGTPFVSAQGLPGILGRDGWLARSVTTQGTFLCRVPVLTTAPRLDIHFWWNTGEMILLMATAHTFLRTHLQPSAQEVQSLNAGSSEGGDC